VKDLSTTSGDWQLANESQVSWEVPQSFSVTYTEYGNTEVLALHDIFFRDAGATSEGTASAGLAQTATDE
jgi:hypothetical protein